MQRLAPQADSSRVPVSHHARRAARGPERESGERLPPPLTTHTHTHTRKYSTHYNFGLWAMGYVRTRGRQFEMRDAY